jgi:hypothetical protein
MWSWMMLPFGIVVIVTQAHGYIGAPALIITTVFCLVAVYYHFSARYPRCSTGLLWLLGDFGIPLDTDLVHLLSALRSIVRHKA